MPCGPKVPSCPTLGTLGALFRAPDLMEEKGKTLVNFVPSSAPRSLSPPNLHFGFIPSLGLSSGLCPGADGPRHSPAL